MAVAHPHPKMLSEKDVIETSGVQALEELLDLEVLFLTFEEIGSALARCKHLKRLALLDNGLKTISGLAPVSNTLTQLCLCDQALTRMTNLNLPNLRDLYLHRNSITIISGLSGCPRLKKLWLFQNKISEITDLHSVPELQECWLQANNISSLDGLEYNYHITNLGLAGNPISDFAQLQKLATLQSLKELSLSDIHFGRCTLVDEVY